MEFEDDQLIAREVEIAGYLLRGSSTGEIAGRMGLSRRLIEAHIRNMREKMNAADTIILIQLLKERADKGDASDSVNYST